MSGQSIVRFRVDEIGYEEDHLLVNDIIDEYDEYFEEPFDMARVVVNYYFCFNRFFHYYPSSSSCELLEVLPATAREAIREAISKRDKL